MAAAESPLVARLFGLGSHGLIFGTIGFALMIGAATGPLLAGYLFDVINSYQMAFLVSALIAFFGLISTAFLRPIRGTEIKT